jgi:hypothetical protein
LEPEEYAIVVASKVQLERELLQIELTSSAVAVRVEMVEMVEMVGAGEVLGVGAAAAVGAAAGVVGVGIVVVVAAAAAAAAAAAEKTSEPLLYLGYSAWTAGDVVELLAWRTSVVLGNLVHAN